MLAKKKAHPKFNVPNYGTKSRKRVKERWRKQRGIDNKKRVKKAFMGAEPTIGYRNPEEVRHVRLSGKRLTLVHNVADIEAIRSSGMDKTHDAIIAHSVSKRKRLSIVEASRKYGIGIANHGRQKEEPANKGDAEKGMAAKGVGNEH